jgi:hypothetical protein
MKNYRSRVTPAVLRDCATAPCAANAKEKAIAWLSTASRFRGNSAINTASNARGQRKIIGTAAEKQKAAPKSGLLHDAASLFG